MLCHAVDGLSVCTSDDSAWGCVTFLKNILTGNTAFSVQSKCIVQTIICTDSLECLTFPYLLIQYAKIKVLNPPPPDELVGPLIHLVGTWR
jgi:hypothetical protein